MPVRKYTQNGFWSFLLFLPVLAFCLGMLIKHGFEEPVVVIIFTFIILTLIVCILTFFRLTIILDDTNLTFSMGIGLIRKTFPLSDIESCKPVRNSRMTGMGIHLTSSGWLYNVSGRDAIELTFKSSRNRIRIGTDKPEEIIKVLEESINGSMAGSYYEKGGHGGLYLILILVAASIFLPLMLVIPMSQDPDVAFTDSGMTITGMYGLTLDFTDITFSDTMQKMPVLKSRTNGYASARMLKGHFRLQDHSKAILFIYRDRPPYIHLRTSARTIYLNFENPSRTREVFDAITEKIK
ncbi:MAG TPA: hypothetical protein PLE95_06055 [Bacteroidales bacterium]|nr:hypothetical protein [Bacteroidales bacterium]